jgi:hypothetical protein
VVDAGKWTHVVAVESYKHFGRGLPPRLELCRRAHHAVALHAARIALNRSDATAALKPILDHMALDRTVTDKGEQQSVGIFAR